MFKRMASHSRLYLWPRPALCLSTLTDAGYDLDPRHKILDYGEGISTKRIAVYNVKTFSDTGSGTYPAPEAAHTLVLCARLRF